MLSQHIGLPQEKDGIFLELSRDPGDLCPHGAADKKQTHDRGSEKRDHRGTPPRVFLFLRNENGENDERTERPCLRADRGVAQYRAFGIPIDVAVETNVTHEHLDYHRTMKRYLAAKLKLFKNANTTLDGKRIGVVNADDPSADEFKAAIESHISYGVNGGDVRARQVQLHSDGVEYYVKYDGRKIHVCTRCIRSGKLMAASS